MSAEASCGLNEAPGRLRQEEWSCRNCGENFLPRELKEAWQKGAEIPIRCLCGWLTVVKGGGVVYCVKELAVD